MGATDNAKQPATHLARSLTSDDANADTHSEQVVQQGAPEKPPFQQRLSAPNLHTYISPAELKHEQEVHRAEEEEAKKNHGVASYDIADTHHNAAQQEASKQALTEPDFDLLDWLHAKLVDQLYRDIKIEVPGDSVRSRYKKRVCFDTIDVQVADNKLDDGFDDDEYRMEDLLRERERGRERVRSPGGSPLQLPASSPASRLGPSMSPSRNGLDVNDFSRYFRTVRTDYPTRPIIKHRGCTFTREHPQFEDLYRAVIPGRRPVLPGRVILVYVSGRKHTWVALDWVLRLFLEDGDRIVVVSAINLPQMLRPSQKRGGPQSPQRVVAKTARMRLRQRNRPEFIKYVARDIMEYIMRVINPNVIAKVSIELAVGTTKEVLKDMYKLYEANLVCAGTKPNLRISAPLQLWLSLKLTDRLVKNFPLPVVVVPAMNMNKYELEMLRLVSERASGTNAATESKEDGDGDEDEDDDDASSIDSDSSLSSGHSLSLEESYLSYEEIGKLYWDYKSDMGKSLRSLGHQPMDENYFANYVKVVTDKSNELCHELKSVDPDARGKGAKLARAITGSNSFGIMPYQTKSLLGPVEKPNIPSMSYKELKRSLQRNSEQANSQGGTAQVPLVNVSEHEEKQGGEEPRKSALTFVGLERPQTRAGGEEEKPKEKPKEKLRMRLTGKSKLLKKSLSYDDNETRERPPLKPLKSHPDMKSRGTETEAPRETKDKKKPSKIMRLWRKWSDGKE